MKNKLDPEVKKMIIKRVVFVILSILLAIGITIFLIIKNKPEIPKTDEVTSEPDTSEKEVIAEKTLSLDETYDYNDLDIELNTTKYKGIDIQYYQIKGLKDESIQIGINYKLKNDLIEKLDTKLAGKELTSKNFWFSSSIDSSFNNTISVSYYVNTYINEENYQFSVCENFDLTTGNKLKLNDIFREDVPIGNILSKELYESILNNKSDLTYHDYEGTLTVNEYPDIEEEIFKIVTDYNSKKDIQFSFDEQKVNLNIDGYSSSILYKNYLEYIVIYDKFLTDDSIFTGEYSKLKDIPSLVKRYQASYQIIEKGSNYYIDISLFDNWIASARNEKVLQSVKELMDEEISKIKEEASKNESKFFVINSSFDIASRTYYDPNTASYVESDTEFNVVYTNNTLKTTKSLFEAEIYDTIIKTFRDYPEHYGGAAYCYDNLALMFLPEGTDFAEDIDLSYKHYHYDGTGKLLAESDKEIPWDIND